MDLSPGVWASIVMGAFLALVVLAAVVAKKRNAHLFEESKPAEYKGLYDMKNEAKLADQKKKESA